MLNRTIARSLMGMIPNRCAAVVTLTPDGAATTIDIANAWLKPLDVRLHIYGGVNLQGDETVIKIPDAELNPAGDGRELRPRDTIAIGSDVYRVISARLTSIRTVWDCVCRKELP